MHTVPGEVLVTLPEQVDLRPRCHSVPGQGDLGSCTANAIAGRGRPESLLHMNPLPSLLSL